jgi:hypothetical protein
MPDGECSLEHLLAGRDVAPVPSRRIASLVSLRKPIAPNPRMSLLTLPVLARKGQIWRSRVYSSPLGIVCADHEPSGQLGGILRSRSGYRHGFEFVDLSQDEREVIGKTCRTLALLQ